MGDDPHGRGEALERARNRGEITDLLAAARSGSSDAADRLYALVYDDLRTLAARHVRGARQGPGTTSLVHEAFMRFARQGDLPYADRTHFFAVASRAMRQIVIDDARARRSAKRGSGAFPSTLDAEPPAAASPSPAPDELLEIDTALEQLEDEDPRLARVVEWHFFGGLTFGEIAEVLDVSERTVLRDWRAARALLHARLSGGPMAG